MTTFQADDLLPLWEQPPGFLSIRPTPGFHHWSFAEVRRELERIGRTVDHDRADRRVALLANPALDNAAATDGLHAGIQYLLPGEQASDHRHTPAALRIGIEGHDVVTNVDGRDLPLDPLDVVLNPSGTWHGHAERGGHPAIWLDVVDLPLTSALGGVLFEPTRTGDPDPVLDPPSTPETLRYPWREMEPALAAVAPVDGVATLPYGDGEVLPTLAVTAYRVAEGATVALPAQTGGTIVMAATGSFETDEVELATNDVVALRGWTPLTLTARAQASTLLVVDTGPALRKLGVHRVEPGR